MSLHQTPLAAPAVTVGLLFNRQWPEATVADALVRAGLRVVSYHDAVALASGLLGGAVDIALVEDHDRLFQDSMTTLRFRGTAVVPVLAIGEGSADDIRAALQYGAADYIASADPMPSMLARVQARLSISRQGESVPLLRVGDCWLEAASRSLQSPCGETQLTPREFALAWVLFEQVGQVVAMSALSQQAWGRDASIAKRTIEQHVSRLRAKLATACEGVVQQIGLHAVHNIGYRLVVSRVVPRLMQDTGFAAFGSGWPAIERRRQASTAWSASSVR